PAAPQVRRGLVHPPRPNGNRGETAQRRWLATSLPPNFAAADMGPAPSRDVTASSRLGATSGSVDLYWLPLGAGGHSVRLNGRIFEAVAARLERRSPCDLYHSALL